MMHSENLDWRTCIQKNQRDTYLVFVLLILTYIGVGLSLDVLRVSFSHTPWRALYEQICQLQFIPFGMLGGLVLGILICIGALFTSNEFLLQGSDCQYQDPSIQKSMQLTTLMNIVDEMRLAAGLNFSPKVFVQNSPQPNAYASGFNEQTGIIVVTQGLLDCLNREELSAVIAHELSHIRHQDTKVILYASVVCHFLISLVDNVLGLSLWLTSQDGKIEIKDGDKNNNTALLRLAFIALLFVLKLILPCFNAIVLAFLSQTRETMADAGCVELMRSNSPLGQALIKIHQAHLENAQTYRQTYSSAQHDDLRRLAYFYDPVELDAWGIVSGYNLFKTHPPLALRLERLGLGNLNQAAKAKAVA